MKRTPSTPDESTPSADLVAERSRQLTPEEQGAGVDDPGALAESILAESEARTLDRDATATEHRRSEDTVEPPG
ncbi:MAG TPA: hypothetical protein VGR20_18795 [Acidimicrobiia bacterium]|nr:hypothetical protein [Acidimicrobiia bacterium]